MLDVLGENGAVAVLKLAGLPDYTRTPPADTLARDIDFAQLAAINIALEDVYGVRSGRDLALRIGQSFVSVGGLSRFGAMVGMCAPAFQALPIQQRVRMGLEAFAAIFNRFTDQITQVREDDGVYVLTVKPSPMTWGRPPDSAANAMLTGMINGALDWATQGAQFDVRERTPNAGAGDSLSATAFIINKNPIGPIGG
ncbi:MAG: hypothetical protein EA396_04890 [Anaerolineaceae bacterium]|nr:MAG: hypothetical protein EA396_04890 [Anaerolineaceae bacterium]